jgi:glyoxylase-like metal-dependent hydrolase (beta-lactamase superfamily II)
VDTFMPSQHLTCIDLDQPTLEGFRQFISAWLYRTDGHTLLIDPGPLSTIPHLLEQLRRQRVDRLDFILLTHIHIDHAGGTGALLKEFPQARIICHPEGVRHLVAPEKLWQGSQKVLGSLATTYGPIVPVPPDSIAFTEEIGSTGGRAYLTPGHAPHHLCFLFRDLLFAGEVAGVRCDVPGGIYMRPAPPPRFIKEVALASLQQMIALAPRRMVFAHYGLVENALEHLHIGQRQLHFWVEGVRACLAVEESRREVATFDWLLERDPQLRNIGKLPADIRSREQTFLCNTLRGMLEYVETLPSTEQSMQAQG